jgi:tetraacyldisaccharide 4'-kinase
LRESVSALARAHAVIVDGPVPAQVAAAPHAILLSLRRAIRPVVGLDSSLPVPERPGPVVALAGIARPERFKLALEAAGWTVARLLAFRDHHRYTRRDLDAIGRAVGELRATAVLTTEKDAVRLLPLRPFPVPIAAVPLDVTVEPAAEFAAWLDARCREARA